MRALAVSPALANDAVLSLSALLILLLAVSLLAVIRQPPWAESAAADDTGEQLAGPEIADLIDAPGPPGRDAPSAPPPLPEDTWRRVVSGGPPWGPAPRPPGLRQ
jgi:hypothetical protein